MDFWFEFLNIQMNEKSITCHISIALDGKCRNLSLGLVTKAKACEGQAKSEFENCMSCS
jgi:hypothetical protein